jgi:hypothetical protein
MNLSGLGRLGKVAGIAGIAIGAVVLLLNALIGTVPGLPSDQQAEIVKLLAILSFGIGTLGIIAWLAGGQAFSTPSVKADSGSIAAGRDIRGSSISVGNRADLRGARIGDIGDAHIVLHQDYKPPPKK